VDRTPQDNAAAARRTSPRDCGVNNCGVTSPVCALTIAGSDPSGGAGIQADLKTFMAAGCYGAGVVTALTAQNTLGVAAAHAPDPEFVALELRLVLDDLPVKAAKTGMLFSGPIARAVAGELKRKNFPLVVDPVVLATRASRGIPLLDEDGIKVLRENMLPLADLATPNRPEAELLTGIAITGRESLFAAMDKMLSFGCKAVLIKGGHMKAGVEAGEAGEPGLDAGEGVLTDWLGRPGCEPLPLPVRRVDTPHTHGTGCALSAAITARLARGDALADAIRASQAWLGRALAAGFAVGRGASPPNHMVAFDANS